MKTQLLSRWQRLLAAGGLGVALAGVGRGAELGALTLLGEDQPRAFFFRQAEGLAAQQRMPQAQWDQAFGRLMGVMGKVLDEEVPGRSRGLETFVRFKRTHPTQAVLLHVNGNARDPRYEGGRFFAGHWLYQNGATVLDEVRADSGETTLRVSDATLFETGGGRYRNANDDIGLCELGADGRPDWTRSEQVQLVSVDRRARTIRVRRGAFGTARGRFARAASTRRRMRRRGRGGRAPHLLWLYNYATTCPRDAQGRTAADIFVAHLQELFAAGGSLGSFDGLEFDVLFHVPSGATRPRRGPDCDADGKRDGGVVGGVNVYGNGVAEFCRQLRAALGEGKLILADGAFGRDTEQRATGSLNGIESEGWPVLGDFAIEDWSGGLNRHEFWRRHGRAPVLSYANVKFVAHGETPGDTSQANVDLGRVRLVFAGAVFTDSAITCAHRPEAPRGVVGIWDELVAGQEQRPGWLGRALGPARHLADAAPDALSGGADGGDWRTRLVSTDAAIVREGEGVRIGAENPAATGFSVALRDVPISGADVCVTVVARSAPMRGAAPETARLLHVSVHPAGGEKAAGREVMSWVGREDFTARAYFRPVPDGRMELRLRFESAEPVWVAAIKVQAAPDLVVREFARGLVLANPSDRTQTFDLAGLSPGRTWRRLRGTAGQDQATNNGEPVAGAVVLPPRDALFLLATTER